MEVFIFWFVLVHEPKIPRFLVHFLVQGVNQKMNQKPGYLLFSTRAKQGPTYLCHPVRADTNRGSSVVRVRTNRLPRNRDDTLGVSHY
jgi:hypothetical protein